MVIDDFAEPRVPARSIRFMTTVARLRYKSSDTGSENSMTIG